MRFEVVPEGQEHALRVHLRRLSPTRCWVSFQGYYRAQAPRVDLWAHVSFGSVTRVLDEGGDGFHVVSVPLVLPLRPACLGGEGEPSALLTLFTSLDVVRHERPVRTELRDDVVHCQPPAVAR